jgi:hypothetical protein
MAQQRLHSALAPIDVLTRLEMEEVTHKELDAAVRARYIGVDSVRFPDLVVTATAANVFLGTGGTMDPPIGPAEGDVWMVRRIIVKSSVLTDTAKYILYRGSTPSDLANAYGPRNVLDAGVGGATPGFSVNVGFYPSTKAILVQPGEQIYAQVLAGTVGNQYYLDGEAIRVPAEMKGKVLT